MHMKHLGPAIALSGFTLCTAAFAPAQAADTLVTCSKPVGIINTGQDGSDPRYTIQCTGGSSAGGITYFAYKLADSATLTELIERVVASWAIQTKDKPITLQSNLSDTSGAAWGCGADNCRIIDYVTGY